MPAGTLKSALDSSFLAASSGAELRSQVGSPLDLHSADPTEDLAAWLLRLGGAVKQTILDWVHWPLPSGINPSERNEVFGWAGPPRPDGPQDAEEAARLHAGLPMTGPRKPGMGPRGPLASVPRHSGIHMWHPTARNALYFEVTNPNRPYPPPNWPLGVDWPPRAIVDKNGKWWPPPGWANGASPECASGYWIYSCGWRNREDWGKDAASIWYGPSQELAEVGNNPRRLLAKEAREDAEFLERLRGFRSGQRGPPEPPRPAQVVERDDGPVSTAAAKQFGMVEILEQQGSRAAAPDEQLAADKILDQQKNM